MNTILIAIILANVLFSFKGFNDIVFFRKYEFHMGSVRSGDQIRYHLDFFMLILVI
jgi:hypothetical protein